MYNAEQQNGELKQNTDFIKSTFKKAIVPCLLSILSANINVFVDGILVGNKIGADALAAINLSLPLFLAMCVVGSFFSSGTAINAASEIGKNNTTKSLNYYRTCVMCLFIVSVLITVFGLLLREPLVMLLCSDEVIRPYVMEYVVITLIGTIPKIMIYIPLWYLRLDGKNLDVLVMMGVMSVGNVILDILFVYVLNWGVFGAGLASVVATTIAFVIGCCKLQSKKCTFVFKPYIMGKKEDWEQIVKAGTPSALNNMLSTVRLLFINSMLMRYGGGIMVAVFSAVNGIAGFGECIFLGIPQAASAMLGVYSGEKDNDSCALILKIECIIGEIYSVAFLIICLAGASFIPKMYGLSEPMFFPLLWMVLSIFPALLCNILSSYYNMTGKNIWANMIIVMRVVVMTFAGLIIAIAFHWNVYTFFLFAELMTLFIWYIGTGFYHRKHPEETRYLLMNMEMEKNGRVLNFSVDAQNENICMASERISEFCSQNGMSVKETMRIQLAMEEVMTLIVSKNQSSDTMKSLSFDVRVYAVSGVTGIRIRYGGSAYNPFLENQEEELYIGIEMIQKMLEDIIYQRTFGVNTLNLLLKEGETKNG